MDGKVAVKFCTVNWDDNSSTLECSKRIVADTFAAGEPVFQQNRNKMLKGTIDSIWGKHFYCILLGI